MNEDTLGAIDRYLTTIAQPQIDPPTALVELAQRPAIPTKKVSRSEGQLLRFLAILVQARYALEIGGLTGYNSWWIANGLMPGGRLVTIDVDSERASIIKENLVPADNTVEIDVRAGRAKLILPQMIDADEGPFDLVLINGDETLYEHYFDLASILTRRGGLIVSNNLIHNGAVLDPAADHIEHVALARFNRFVARRSEHETVILPKIVNNQIDAIGITIVEK